LSAEKKQAIATAAGFPETAFVSVSQFADYKLDFFTPVKQIPHCGHATIATFSYLKEVGRIAGEYSSKETIDGCRSIVFKDGQAFMEQKAPRFEYPSHDLEIILRSLQIGEKDLLPGLMPAIVNTGNAFLIIPIRDEAILSDIRYNREVVNQLSASYGLIGFYLYTHSNHFDATTRMFAPYYGIDEEAATGMAAGPLACYLREKEKKDQLKFRIEQGRFMELPSPSLIEVYLELTGGHIERLFAGGGAYVSRELTVVVP